MIVKVNIVKSRFAVALALGWTVVLSAGPAEAACSLADKLALAKAGYTKAGIEKECAASTSTPAPAPATPSPAVQAPPPEVLAQHLRADPADKADLKAVIKDVQTKLNAFGFGAGTPDGVPGRKTGEAQERLKQAFGVDLAGLPYTEQNRILDYLLASEPGKKYVASVEKLESLSKKVGSRKTTPIKNNKLGRQVTQASRYQIVEACGVDEMIPLHHAWIDESMAAAKKPKQKEYWRNRKAQRSSKVYFSKMKDEDIERDVQSYVKFRQNGGYNHGTPTKRAYLRAKHKFIVCYWNKINPGSRVVWSD